MADFFDTRAAVPRPLGAEGTLKVWLKAAPGRTMKPTIEKLVGGVRGLEHVVVCKQGDNVVATGRGQTTVGATRDACNQLGI